MHPFWQLIQEDRLKTEEVKALIVAVSILSVQVYPDLTPEQVYDKLAAQAETHPACQVKNPPPLVDQKKLQSTLTAAVWADEFLKIYPRCDRDTVATWFANAIEQARSAGAKHGE